MPHGHATLHVMSRRIDPIKLAHQIIDLARPERHERRQVHTLETHCTSITRTVYFAGGPTTGRRAVPLHS